MEEEAGQGVGGGGGRALIKDVLSTCIIFML